MARLIPPALMLALLPAFAPTAPSRAVLIGVAPCPRAEDPKYVGSKSCQKCHYKEHASWAKTEMAQAFATLKPDVKAEAKKKAGLEGSKDYTKDPKCVACHTTGYGKPGGYPAITDKDWTAEEKERAALFEGVGCESCHGPGERTSPFKKENKEYKWADLVKLGAIHPDEKTCTVCHNKESPSFKEFKFEEKVGKDSHEILKLKSDHGCEHKHGK